MECKAIGNEVILKINFIGDAGDDYSVSQTQVNSSNIASPNFGLPINVKETNELNSFGLNGNLSKALDDQGNLYSGKNVIKVKIGNSGLGREKSVSMPRGRAVEGEIRITGIPDSITSIKYIDMHTFRKSYGRSDRGKLLLEYIPIQR